MSVIDDLNKTGLSDEEYAGCIIQLSDHPRMVRRLALINDLEKVLDLLHVELRTKCRSTMINRIYGRYRKLCSARDYEQMFEWRKKHGQRRT